MKLQTARGVRDVPPKDKILKNKIVEIISKKFELYGFAPLETPILERYETLAAKFGAGAGSDVLKETFKLTDQGKRKLGLRFELTTSLGRYVALNPNLKLPFKRYEIGRNFRDGPIKLGRYREFWQCDADTIGSSSMLAEAEQIAILAEVFRELKFDFVIKINNRKLLNGILQQAGIKKMKEAIIAIDKLDKIGKGGVTKELIDRGYTEKQAVAVLEMINDTTLLKVKKQLTNEEGKQGLAELEELFNFLKQMGITEFKFDISLARGQAYYTGTVLEAFLKKNKITSSIASGGRYDDMIGGFTDGRVIPAVGVSFGLEPILDVLRLENGPQTLAKIYIIPINTNPLETAASLRSAGIATSVSLGKKGVSKNLQYASALGIPFVGIIGEREASKNKVLLRDMNSGTEQLLSVNQIIKILGK